MKRVLSLVLALSLVLGSIPAGFAATPTAGETLKGYGLLAGDQSGNLNEDKEITRGEMMVVLARLLGKFDEAKAYSIPSTSKDVAGHWAAAYIAFAEKEAWTSGKGNGMFDPNGKVTLQETAAFMMKALGYTVTDFSKVVDEATKLNLLKDVKTTDATKSIVRADLFTAALNTVNTPSKDSTQKLGEKLGVIKVVASALDPKEATGISQNTMQIKLNKEATAVKAADFSVVDKDGKALEVKDAKLISAKVVWISTADQTAGKLYTVKVAGKEFKVTGLQKDSSLPELDKAASSVKDNVTLRLVFSKKLDPRNALVAANYTFTNGLTATAAEFEKDKDGVDVRTVVLLTTSAQELNKLYKITVGAGVTDFYGNKVQTEDDKNFLNFTGRKADTTAPRISSVVAVNGQKLAIEFTEDSDLSKDTALNVANYVFVNKTDANKTLTATAAKFEAVDNINKRVILTTTEQVQKASYELTINNVADKFGNVIISNKASFAGAPLDKTGPKVTGVQALSNTVVKVIFDETVEAASAIVAANYVMTGDLAVTKAVVDADTDSIVWLTTSPQKAGTTYKLTVSNVKDEYANPVGTSNTQYFNGLAEDTSKPSISSASSYVKSGATYVTVTFSKAVTDETAKVAANYYFGTEIGYGIAVTKVNDTTFDVKVNELKDGSVYTVVVNNVIDLYGNGMDFDKNEKQFVGKVSDDTAAPRLVTAVTVDKNTVKLIFDKAMTSLDTTTNYTVKRDTTVVGSSTNTKKVSVAANKKEVSIRYTAPVFVEVDNKSTTYTVEIAGTVKGNNGAAIDANYLKKDVYSTSTTPADVKVVSVSAVNNTSVDVKFNQEVELVTGTFVKTAITFTNQSKTQTITVANAALLSTDASILRVTTSALTAGDQYEVSFVGVAGIQDSFNDKGLTTTASDLKYKVYAIATTNSAPNYTTYAMGTLPGSMVVTFNEDLDKAMVQDTDLLTLDKSLFTIKDGSTVVGTATFVALDADDAAKVHVYFNNDGMKLGKSYELVIAKNAVKDLSLLGNDEIKLNFGVTSTTRDAVKIEGVTVSKTFVDATIKDRYTNLTVVFNKPVTMIDPADFKVTSGSTVLTAGTDYTVVTTTGSNVTEASKPYRSIVVIKLAGTTYFTTGSAVKVEFVTGTNVVAKDAATKPVADSNGNWESKTVTVPAE